MNRERLKLEIDRSRRPFAVWVAFGALCLIAGWVTFHNINFDNPFTDQYRVRAAFDEARGIRPGAHEVRIAGVKVGVIEAAEVEEETAVLTLRIEERYGRLYRDARLELRPVSPLQDMYVDIEDRGRPRAGVADEDFVIASSRTESPVDYSRVLRIFEPEARAHLATLLDELGEGLPDNGRYLRESFAQAVPFLDASERLARAIAQRDRQTRRLVHNIGELTAVLADRDGDLETIVREGNRSLAALADNDASFTATLAEIPPTVTTLRSTLATLRAAEDHLDPALVELLPTADRLDDGLVALDRLAREGRPAVSALRSPVRQLDRLPAQLTQFSRTTGDLLDRIVRLSPTADHAIAQLLPCREEIAQFFHRTIDLTKFRDQYRTIARAQVQVGVDTGGTVINNPTLTRLRPCFPEGDAPPNFFPEGFFDGPRQAFAGSGGR